ncbi:MAG: hypothetical protein U5Q03_00425 [Bacteroidota bacterium]|nr:hypothetical protein [Bacteroidota bacterium]
MKRLLTILLNLSFVFAFSQSNETADRPTSYSEVNSADISTNFPAQKSKPVNQTNPSDAPMGLTFYTDRGVFNTDNPGLPVETWDPNLIGPNNLCGGFAPLNELTSNSCFSAGDIMPGLEVNMIPANEEYVLITTGYFLGLTSNVVGPNTFTDNMIISFDPPVRAIGFDFFQPVTPDGFTISVYDDNGVFIGSGTSPATFEEFWGVYSDTPIGEILFVSDGGGGAELIGNLAFGDSVPATPLSDYAIYIGIFLILAFTAIRFRRAFV